MPPEFPNKDTQFQPGQSGNPNGRPRKNFTDHINDIKAKGYKAPTATEYFDMIGLLISMTEEDLKEFASQKERPYWVTLIIKDLDNKAVRTKMMQDYRDWLYGASKKQMDVTSGGEKINNAPATIVFKNFEEEE